jgi:hypothetical protein
MSKREEKVNHLNDLLNAFAKVSNSIIKSKSSLSIKTSNLKSSFLYMPCDWKSYIATSQTAHPMI